MSATKRTINEIEAPQDLITAAASGDRLETLIALRSLLAEKLQHTSSARDVSAIARRLMQCITEIEAIEKARNCEGNFISDFRKRIKLPYGREEQPKTNTKEILDQKKKIDKGYKLGKLAGEHEYY